MVNIIWVLMIVAGIIAFIIQGRPDELLKTMTESAEGSIQLLIALLGIMSVWTGIVKVCEKAGIVRFIGKLLNLPMRLLFPGLDQKSPTAVGNIIMNISSNMMGLSNAATPFGIKAMEDLQKINREKDKASDYMVTFLIINAACVQLIPSTVISIRGSLGAKNPSDIIIPTIIATLIALVFGLISNVILKKIYK